MDNNTLMKQIQLITTTWLIMVAVTTKYTHLV